jgi:hypothetical protein
MKDSELQIKEKFYVFAKSMISDKGDLDLFEEYWSEKHYRWAYGIYRKFVTKSELALDVRSNKLDENFFWLFVN